MASESIAISYIVIGNPPLAIANNNSDLKIKPILS